MVLLCAVNVFGDAGNRFHSAVDSIAETLINGHPAYVASGNLRERELRYRYICRMHDDTECVIFGGSNVICISSFDVGEVKFVNLGVSRGRIDDCLAQLGIMRFLGKDKHIRRIIFGPQELYFNRKVFEVPNPVFNKEALKPYMDYMLSIIRGEETDENIPEPNFNENILFMSSTALSLSYFQANINYIVSSGMLTFSKSGLASDGSYYMPDGSLLYWRLFLNNNEDDIVRKADNMSVNQYSGHIDYENWNIFVNLIEYLIARGVTVELYLRPLAPALWDKIYPDKCPFLIELEDSLVKLAGKYSLRVIGSYNPYKVGITNADYYDPTHVRREATSKYFNLKPVVND